MKLERDLLFLDTETTGTDPQEDRILEFAVTILVADGAPLSTIRYVPRKRWSQRFNPGRPIPPEATAVHGIADADIKDCPTFASWAKGIATAIKGKDLAGYNIWRFDLPLLDAELRRCGHKLDLTGVRVIDCYGIFAKKAPRDLAAAVQRFCGREHVGAHGAQADTDATVDVLIGQLAEFQDLCDMDAQGLAEFSLNGNKPADLAGKLYYGADGELRFNFGQWRDQLVSAHLDYADWMLSKGKFPGSTCDLLREVLHAK